MREAFLFLSSGKKGFSFPQFCITEVYLFLSSGLQRLLFSMAHDKKGFSFPQFWIRETSHLLWIREAYLFLSFG
jgi:hypothetical protein